MQLEVIALFIMCRAIFWRNKNHESRCCDNRGISTS